MLDPLPLGGRALVLRRLDPADLPAFQAYRTDETVGRYQGWSAQTDEQALAFIEAMSSSPLFPPGQWMQLAVADRETNGLVGDIGICISADGRSAEVGFTISPHYQRRGLGTEMLREAIDLILEHTPVMQIVCITDARNTPSIRLLERTPMRRIATAEAVFRGEPCVEHTYAAFREERGRP